MDYDKFYSVYCSLAEKMHCVPVSKSEYLSSAEVTLTGTVFFVQIKRELKNNKQKHRLFVSVVHPEKMCRYSVSCDKIIFLDLTPVEHTQKSLLTIYAKESTFSVML